MNLYVLDLDFNRIGIIDDYNKLEIERHYKKSGELRMQIDGSAEILDLLQKGRILVKEDDWQHGYLIMHRDYFDEKTTELEITAPSINSLLNRRIVLGQQEFKGNVENVIKSFVQVNAVNPTNVNRTIPNLVISSNSGIDIETTEGTSNDVLDEYLYEICNKHDMSWEIVLDIPNKQFIFTTWQGADRSTEQSINPHIIFSKDRENVLKQNYVESDLDYKSTAIVAGEGEGSARTYHTVNNEYSGFDRFEVYVDARDLQSTYQVENEEVTIPEDEYKTLLHERGLSKLSEYQKIQTFESEIDMYSQYTFGVDYDLGDKISIVHDNLNIIMHTRVVSSYETYEKQGNTLEIDFGDNIPTIKDKIKRAVK